MRRRSPLACWLEEGSGLRRDLYLDRPRCHTTALSRPLPEEIDRNNDQRDGESDPDAEDAAVRVKAEHIAEREAEEPVAAKVHKHGLPRLARAAKCAGGNGLDAIEDLKGSGQHEQACAQRHNRLILSVDMQQRP